MTVTALSFEAGGPNRLAVPSMSKSLSWPRHENLPEPEPPPVGSRQAPTPGTIAARATLDFTQVYAEHFDFVWRFAAHRGVPHAALDDVTQEVFVIVHRQLESFEGRSTLRTWIAGIAFNLVRAHLRKQSNRRHEAAIDAAEQVASLSPLPLEVLEQKSAAELLDSILEKMTALQREAFILCEVEGIGAGEAAEALGVNENTMRARLHDARLVFDAATARLRVQQAWSAR